MFNRFGLDRFKKAQSAEPFSVNAGAVVTAASTPTQAKPSPLPAFQQPQVAQRAPASEPVAAAVQATTIGGGQSAWQPPPWSVEPRPGVYWLEVVKDGEIVDKIALDKRRHIFGRQVATCDFVLDHPSLSRQHAAVVQHKNGSIYVIDLGSVHGTFVANERLTKDNPVELEVGQSLRFAASTRIYILRKSSPQALSVSQPIVDFVLPPPPDPSDEEAVVAYNTVLNRLGVAGPNIQPVNSSPGSDILSRNRVAALQVERPTKRPRKSRVTFRDQYDGVLVEVVGISDGADVSTEPGPVGVKEGGSLGKYESLVQVTVIPKDQVGTKTKAEGSGPKGVTQKLQQYLEKVKSPGKGGLYGDLYGDSFAGQVGAAWANFSKTGDADASAALSQMEKDNGLNGMTENLQASRSSEVQQKPQLSAKLKFEAVGDDDDLFGDSGEERFST